MGEAIDAACELIRDGTVVLQITGTDGLIMEGADIAFECLRRAEDRR
jgi:hypothetical protein